MKDPQTWATMAERLGVPVAILTFMLAAIGFFFWKSLWPWMTQQVDILRGEARELREQRSRELDQWLKEMNRLRVECDAERAEFLAALERRDDQLKPVIDSQRENTMATRELVKASERLADRVERMLDHRGGS